MSLVQDDITMQVKSALAQTLNLDSVANLNVETKLKEELGLDSMTSLTFLMTLEDTIPGFAVNPDTLETSGLETVGTVVNYIVNELNKN